MKKWYQELFSGYADQYDQEEFTKGTLGEVDFLEKELKYDKTGKILDIGCGTGRHAIELARRGYSVTGVDLSPSMLDKAREKTMKSGVKVDFQVADARQLPFTDQFDLVVIICGGAFPLMETDEMNFQILQSAAKALKKDGKLIFTTLNALYPLYHSVKDFINSNIVEGMMDNYRFDLMTFRESSRLEVVDDEGNRKILSCDERYYVPSEITWLLKTLEFKTINIYGCELGNFSRNRGLNTDDYEMLVVAEF